MPLFPKGIDLRSKEEFTRFHNEVRGTNLFERYYPADEYIRKAEQDGLWLEKRELKSAALTEITIRNTEGLIQKGLNFASNNYLGLANHPFTIQAGIEAATEFGVNSAGSPLAFGATKYFAQLRDEIGELLGSAALIFSSAWLACFGFVKSVMKDYDHVLLDELCDRSLFQGAHYTTKSVHTFKHLDAKDLQSKLEDLRKNQGNGILVITDCLFAVDSCSPDIVRYQQLAAQNQAYLLLNLSHDFCMFGDSGKGLWQEQGLKQLNNVFFLGSASKSLGVNFGFIALPGSKKNHIHFFKYFCSTYMFTNAINPVQANSGLAILRMARSHLGTQLRQKVLSNASYLRDQLIAKGYRVLGRVSPFVCVPVGKEILSRMITRALMDNDIFVNVVQYPVAKLGESNIRICLTPNHTQQQIDRLVEAYDWAFKACQQAYDQELPAFKQRHPEAKL